MLEILRKLGFTTYDANILLALGKLHEATASEISVESGVPRTRVYNVLEELEKKDLVIRTSDKPIKYALGDVDAYIHKILDYKRKGLEELSKEAKEITKALKSHAKGTEEDRILIIYNKKAIENIIRASADGEVTLLGNLLSESQIDKLKTEGIHIKHIKSEIPAIITDTQAYILLLHDKNKGILTILKTKTTDPKTKAILQYAQKD